MKQLLKTQVNSTNEESSHNNRSQQERGRGGDQGINFKFDFETY